MKTLSTRNAPSIKLSVANLCSISIPQETWEKNKPTFIKLLMAAGAFAGTVWIVRILHKNYILEVTHQNKMNEMRLDASIRSRESERKFQHNIIDQMMKQKENVASPKQDCTDATEIIGQGETTIEDSRWKSAKECIDAVEKVKYFAYTPIPVGGIITLWSRSNLGKTTLATQIGVAIACGRSTGLDLNSDGICEAQIVKIFDSENDVPAKLEEYKKAGFLTENISLKVGTNYNRLKVLGNKICEEIENASTPTTIMVDNITDMVDPPSESEFRSVKKQLQSALDKAKKRGAVITIIFVLHSESTGKKMRGTEIKRDLSTDSIALKDEGKGNIKLIIDKCKNKPRTQYNVHIEDNPYRHFVIDVEDEVCRKEDQLCSAPGNKKNNEPKLPITDEARKEILSFHQSGVEGHGWGPTYEKVGRKYFESQSTMIREVRKWEAQQ